MIRSMTGFGQAELENDRYIIQAEFKALNNKFLELNIRLPRNWQSMEPEVRKVMTPLIERGSCSLYVNVNYKNASDQVMPVNKEAARYYLKELSSIAGEFNVGMDAVFQNIVTLPNLFSTTEPTRLETMPSGLMDVIHKAFNSFEKFRMKEGEMLSSELERMTGSIIRISEEISELEPERMINIRSKIEMELEKLKINSIDKNRYEQEMIYYLEKLDINEELSRLLQHCAYFLETMKAGSSGKKLSFIAQEMGREINTLGAKANHFRIQQRVVELKDELEKIKEQLANTI